jgi:hypothetical protein
LFADLSVVKEQLKVSNDLDQAGVLAA